MVGHSAALPPEQGVAPGATPEKGIYWEFICYDE
jgi:hypothetical protein